MIRLRELVITPISQIYPTYEKREIAINPNYIVMVYPSVLTLTKDYIEETKECTVIVLDSSVNSGHIFVEENYQSIVDMLREYIK